MTRNFELTHQRNIEELRQLARAPRRPVGYNADKLKRLMLQKTTTATVKNSRSRVYIGERGGRYYKRRRADGTTYREYTIDSPRSRAAGAGSAQGCWRWCFSSPSPLAASTNKLLLKLCLNFSIVPMP